MNREQALQLLELDVDASQEQADQAYEARCADLKALLAVVSLKTSAREQLEQALAELDGAISHLRGLSAYEGESSSVSGHGDGPQGGNETSTVPVAAGSAVTRVNWSGPGEAVGGDPNATRVAGAPRARAEAKRVAGAASVAEAESVDGAAEMPVRESSPARRKPPRRFAFTRLHALAATGLLSVLALLGVLWLSGGDGPSPAPALPVPAQEQVQAASEPEPVGGELTGLRQEWQLAGDRLQDHKLELSGALERARAAARSPAAASATDPDQQTALGVARERVSLVEAYVVDDDYLRVLDSALVKSLPEAQGAEGVRSALRALSQLTSDAAARRIRLEQLDDALTARQAMAAQLSRLSAEGVAEWPPEPVAVPQLFEDTSVAQVERIVTAASAAVENVAAGEFSLAADGYRQVSTGLASLRVTSANLHSENEQRIQDLYELGKQAIVRNRLSRPADGSALYYALEIETLEPDRAEAEDLMAGIRLRYITLARSQLARGDESKARRYANMAVAMGAEPGDVADIQAAASASAEQQFQPLRPVEEVEGIAMMTLPLGNFTMGAKSSALVEFADGLGSFFGSIFGGGDDRDYSGSDTEGPAHPVSVDSWVAISRSEITVAQFRRFVNSTDYFTDAELHGYSYAFINDEEIRVQGKNWRHDYLGRQASPELPVIHVSHRDATAFTAWLSSRTGADYRLPSETEFEYAARAGVSTLTPWGRGMPPPGAGNFRGEKDAQPQGWGRGGSGNRVKTVKGYSDGAFGPTPVGTVAANNYGLESLLGNLSEWTADCYHQNYAGKDSSQRARGDGDCDQRMVRGTDWSTDARLLRLSYRDRKPEVYSSNTLGFRVARDVDR